MISLARLTLLAAFALIFGCTHLPDDLRNASEPLPGLASSGQPEPRHLEMLAGRGYTTIIDLRTPGEDRGFDEAALVGSLGMSYVSLPIGGAAAVSYENAAALDAALTAAPGPVLVHCASGNRVGALLALREKLAGASDAEALATGLAGGLTGLEDTVVERLGER